MSHCQSNDCRGYNVTSTSVSINFIDVDSYKSYKNRSIKNSYSLLLPEENHDDDHKDLTVQSLFSVV